MSLFLPHRVKLLAQDLQAGGWQDRADSDNSCPYDLEPKGVTASFRSAGASVSVVERDPVTRLEARLDGFEVPAKEKSLQNAAIVVTVSAAESVITGPDVPFADRAFRRRD